MSNSGKFILGALFGASVAGVAALLYAPKSGKELRADLAHDLDELLVRASEYTDYAVERGVEFYDAASAAKDDIQVNLKDSADHLKHQFEDLKTEAGNEWDKVKEDLHYTKENLAGKASEVKDEANRLGEDLKATGEIVLDSVKESYHNLANQDNEEFDLSDQDIEE